MCLFLNHALKIHNGNISKENMIIIIMRETLKVLCDARDYQQSPKSSQRIILNCCLRRVYGKLPPVTWLII